jgi:hypothetical protein
MKVKPRSDGLDSVAPFAASEKPGRLRGQAIARTLSSDNTTADRLRELRNERREKNKREYLPG